MHRLLRVLCAYFEALLVAVLLATFARTFLVQAFRVPTASMAENLVAGDHILVNKFIFDDGESKPRLLDRLLPTRPVRRGDVVVFKFPLDASQSYVKRCVAVPGDTIAIVDKTLFLNGFPVEDQAYTYRMDPRVYERSHFLAESFRLRDNYGPYTVPEGHYFCLGDNRDHSNDSRFWGTVPAHRVQGRAWLIYWSSNTAENPDAQGTMVSKFDHFRRWLADVRTHRVLRLVR